MSKDALHIHIGLIVFFATTALVQKGRITGKDLVPVFAMALIIEILDLQDDRLSLGHMRFPASAHDIFNAVVWPCLIVILARVKAIFKP